MRTNHNFGILYILMLVCQIALCNFSPLGPYIMLTLLPAMILCMPLGIGTIWCMVLAFFTGLSVDWISEGLLGINAAALVPVALARKTVIRLFFGEDLITRKDSFSFNKYGMGKVSAAQATVLALFLIIYITLDGAGTRSLWFSLSYFGASLLCNLPLALLTTHVLTPDDRRREGRR